ncbi:MAG: type II toxin-antitoxin system YoeB family toxin [Candidatus Gracilibacteria bacterium]|jgi:Txe/YoeB family toxin of Txe-Axe toxin-antitoxin module|nr:type II toxin-antitoxin system YoeB family toxin [Candidatus Gracilibacteria bacterium]
MKKYQIVFTKQAFKDVKSLSPKLKEKLKFILQEVISENPFAGKKLLGELEGNYSHRLDLKNRILYGIDRENYIVYIKRARTHYGD